MSPFRKRPAASPPPAPGIAESLQGLVQSAGQPSLFAHSEFVKQVTCSRCGAPKRLPSKTAYLYCDRWHPSSVKASVAGRAAVMQ